MVRKLHGFNLNQLRKQRVAATFGLLLALGLPWLDAHAALLFRSLERVNGQQHWSPIKDYANPSDTAHAQGTAAPVEVVRVFLSGEVTHADVTSAAVMENLLMSGRQKLAGNTVWFSSSGGDIDAGMKLGRMLRKLRVFTLVGKNDQCLSACVLAFMGGERRSVAGRLGIHRPYFPFTDDTADRPARFRNLQQAMRNFIEELDFPDSLYEAVMLVPPESMHIVAPADLQRFYLEGISPSSEDRIDAAAARRLNLSMLEYLRRKAKAPACAFFDAGEGRCEGKVQAAAVSGGAADDPGNMQTSEGAPAAGADANPSGQLIRLRRPPAAVARDPA
jgi:hypothetical protein